MQVPTTGVNADPNVGVYAGPAWNAALKSYTWTDVDGKVHLWRQVSW